MNVGMNEWLSEVRVDEKSMVAGRERGQNHPFSAAVSPECCCVRAGCHLSSEPLALSSGMTNPQVATFPF